MIKAAIGASISVGLLALGGCGGKPVPIGTFRGTRTVAVRPGTDPAIADQLRRVVLQIKPDGLATLEDGGIPWELQIARDGDRLDCEVLAVSGRNIAKHPPELPRRLSAKVRPDGGLELGGLRLDRDP